jgi:hypothetical protein
VVHGNVQVESNFKRKLKSKEEETLHIGDDAVLTESAYLTINYQVVPGKVSRTRSGLLGLLAIIGVGAAVATGVAVGEKDNNPPPVSPAR